MDGEEGLQGLPGHPNPAGPTDLLPWVWLWGHSWGPARAQPPQRDGPRARGAAPGAEHKTHGTKQGESGHPAPRLVIWSVYMAGGQGAGQEGQWQRIYIKIKGKGGERASVSERGPGCGEGRLHFVGHQLLVSHAVGQRALALVQPLHPVGFKVDVAGNILDVLHVCPAGKGDGAITPAHVTPNTPRPNVPPALLVNAG